MIRTRIFLMNLLVKIKSNSVVWVIICAFKVFLKKPIGENLWFVEKALDKSVYFCIFFSSPELKVDWIKIDLWWYWTVFKIKSPKKKIRRKTKARIRCDEELGILCWPVTPAVWSLLYSGKTVKSVDNSVIDYSLTINMKTSISMPPSG